MSITATSLKNSCNSIHFINVVLKYGVVVVESLKPQPTYCMKSLFKILALTVGVNSVCEQNISWSSQWILIKMFRKQLLAVPLQLVNFWSQSKWSNNGFQS